MSRWLGLVAEQLRTTPGAVRSPTRCTPRGCGRHAHDVIAAERLDHQLGPIARLAELGGDVLLLGVDHSSNTTIHLAEQQRGRGQFHRYPRDQTGLWIEFPQVSGESHRFDDIEPLLRAATNGTRIASCRARRIPIAQVLAVTHQLLAADPAALLCTTATVAASQRCASGNASTASPAEHRPTSPRARHSRSAPLGRGAPDSSPIAHVPSA